MSANLENVAVATGLEKISLIPIPKKGSPKESSNSCTTALISYASKVMPNILKARLQQYVNHELPDVQAGLEKAKEPESAGVGSSLKIYMLNKHPGVILEHPEV